MNRNEDQVQDQSTNWYGFMEKVSRDSKTEKIVNELEKLFPGGHCGNPDCLKNCVSAFEIGTGLGMDLKSFITDCVKNAFVPDWGCFPITKTAFDDYKPSITKLVENVLESIVSE